MNRIRVLHTVCRIYSGGVEQRLAMIARGLGSDRYEHAVICQEAKGVIPQYLRDAGWQLHEIGLAPGILNRAWHSRAYTIAKDFRPTIVHGAVYEGEALAWGIGLRMPNVKVVLEETSDPVDRRWTGNALMRLMCMRADACIGVSPKVSEYLRDKLRIREEKITSINNAVPQLQPPSAERLLELRSHLGIREGDIIIGSVGRVEDYHKRFSDIIRALPEIRRVNPSARLLIVGEGPDLRNLRQLADGYGLEEAVIFAGYQGSARDYYYLMNVFVLASAREAFGLVLVEAMLSGVPIVATRVGGIPFVLDEGKCGILVQPEQPGQIAAAVVKLLADPSLAHIHKHAAIQRAQSEFSPNRYLREMEDLYSRLLKTDEGS